MLFLLKEKCHTLEWRQEGQQGKSIWELQTPQIGKMPVALILVKSLLSFLINSTKT